MLRLLPGLQTGPLGDVGERADAAVRVALGILRPGREAEARHGPDAGERLAAVAHGPVLVQDIEDASQS